VYVQWLAANIAKSTCASNADWHHEIKDYMGLPGNEALKALVMNPPSISPPRKETREEYRERKLKQMHLRVPRKIGDSQRASGTASDTKLAILSDDLEETRDWDLSRLNDSAGSPKQGALETQDQHLKNQEHCLSKISVTIKDIKRQGNVIDKMNAEMERRSAAWHDEPRNMSLHIGRSCKRESVYYPKIRKRLRIS